VFESAYVAGLSRATGASRDDDRLQLTGEGVEFNFETLPRVPTADLIGTVWLLDTLIEDAAASSVIGAPATLLLAEDETLSGSTGCRNLTGEYVVSADTVQFTSFAADGDCPAELQRQDGQAVRVLGDGFTVEIDGRRLTVISASNEGLAYRAQE
jgi:heat shock protein HslJ